MNEKIFTNQKQVCIPLPEWLQSRQDDLVFSPGDMEDAMRLAITLSRCNVDNRTGGPFAALVVNLGKGSVISAGVNCVEAQSCSSAHAEIMALSLAQQAMGTWNLRETAYAPLTLITSCEPCAMCLGAIPWAGVSQVICGATKRDAEAAGFDEGERPSHWEESLAERDIKLVTGVLQKEASAVLLDYARAGQTIYNP